MRIQVKTILGWLCLVALLCARANYKTFAHDLPSDGNLLYTATVDCFAQNHAVKPMEHDGCYTPPLIVDRVKVAQATPLAPINYSIHYRAVLNACRQLWASQQTWATLNKSTNDLSHWWNRAKQYLPAHQTASTNPLIIAQPENGKAPSPCRHATPPRQAQELAQLLKIMDDLQCEVYGSLHNLDAITLSLAQAISPSSQALLHNFVTLGLPHPTEVEKLPLTVGPQFVVFGLNN